MSSAGTLGDTYDGGEVSIQGEPVVLNRTSDALERGIYMVPQEPLLFPNMTVEENILIGFRQSKAELQPPERLAEQFFVPKSSKKP